MVCSSADRVELQKRCEHHLARHLCSQSICIHVSVVPPARHVVELQIYSRFCSAIELLDRLSECLPEDRKGVFGTTSHCDDASTFVSLRYACSRQNHLGCHQCRAAFTSSGAIR